MQKTRSFFSTTRIIILGFACGILIGTLLLCLPFASAPGVETKPVDALFTATTSLCVTGLVTVNTFENWSLFGQIVILLLIQFGGLGVITFTTVVLLVLGRRITLKERMLIAEAYNLDTLSGMVKLVRRILKGTLLVEGVGALLFALVFVPQYGLIDGLWKSVFNSISAFCNAGIDILGPDSLAPYRSNVIVNLTTSGLIILGGIGFPVWWDVLRILRLKRQEREKLPWHGLWRKLELHTKLAITMTLVLIFGGMLLVLLLEYHNPDTLASLSFPEKLLAAFFQSVTLRTAGFFTIPQQYFYDDSAFLFVLLMFIGGSPSGTAGGVKTVTVLTLLLATMASIRGKDAVEVYGRTIPDSYVKKAMAVMSFGVVILIGLTLSLTLVESAEFLDILFEVASALGTVGLTRGITSALSVAGKLIVVLGMFLGRVGPLSMALAFNRQNARSLRHFPEEKIRVG